MTVGILAHLVQGLWLAAHPQSQTLHCLSFCLSIFLWGQQVASLDPTLINSILLLAINHMETKYFLEVISTVAGAFAGAFAVAFAVAFAGAFAVAFAGAFAAFFSSSESLESSLLLLDFAATAAAALAGTTLPAKTEVEIYSDANDYKTMTLWKRFS